MASPVTVFERALDKYKQTIGNPLSKKDDRILNTTSFNELLSEVRKAEGLHSADGKTRRVIKRLLPFLNALNRFGGIVDVCIQANPSPASLIWGGIRLLLLVSRDCGIFFDGLVDMMEKIGDAFPRLDSYASMFPQSRLDDIVLAAYGHAISFLTMASRTFSTNGLKTLMRSLWKPLLREYESTVESLNRQVAIADAEFHLLCAQGVQGEIAVATKERSEQSKERVLALRERQSQTQERQMQIVERQRAEAERKEQADERRRQQNADRHIAAEVSKISAKESEQHRADVMAWLSRVDTEGPLAAAMVKHRANPNSCKWVFGSPRYQEWYSVSDPSHALWISSGPGTGKTVLAGHIVHELQQHASSSSPTLYFFCTTSNVSPDDIAAPLRTLICQMLDQLPDIPDHIENEYRTQMHKGVRQIQKLPLLTIQDLFMQTIRLFQSVYIVIDGLDEVKERSDILVFLEALGRRGADDSVHVLICCRAEADIRQHLNTFAKIRIRPVNTRADIETFVDSSMKMLPFQDDERAKTTTRFLKDRAAGVFIWVRLVTELLRSSISAADYDETLTSIPLDLHQLYCLIIEKLHNRIGKLSATRKKLMQNLFKWLALSPRPLLMSELRDALAATYGSGYSDQAHVLRISEDLRPSEDSLLSFCGTLINEDDGVISLLHHSAKEFLLGSDGDRSEIVQSYMVSANEGHIEIGVLCLDYLAAIEQHMHPLFSQEQLLSHKVETIEDRLRLRDQISAAFPLYELTCHQWAYHLEKCTVTPNKSIRDAFSRFESCSSWFQGWALFHPEGCVPNSKLFRKVRKHGRDICNWIDLIDVLLGPLQAQTYVDLIMIGSETAELSTCLEERRVVPKVRINDAQIFLEHQILVGNAAMVRKILNLKRLPYEVISRAIRLAKSRNALPILWMLCEHCISQEQSPTAFELARQHNDEEVANILSEHIEMCASTGYGSSRKKAFDWGVYYYYRDRNCRPRLEPQSDMSEDAAEVLHVRRREEAETQEAVKEMQISKLAKCLSNEVLPSSDELLWASADTSSLGAQEPATLAALRAARSRMGQHLGDEWGDTAAAPTTLQAGRSLSPQPGNRKKSMIIWSAGATSGPSRGVSPSSSRLDNHLTAPDGIPDAHSSNKEVRRIWRKLHMEFYPNQDFHMFVDEKGRVVQPDFKAELAGQFTLSKAKWVLSHQRRVSIACGMILCQLGGVFSMDEPLYLQRYTDEPFNSHTGGWQRSRCLSFEVAMVIQAVEDQGSAPTSLLGVHQATSGSDQWFSAPISPVKASDFSLTSDANRDAPNFGTLSDAPNIVTLKEVRFSEAQEASKWEEQVPTKHKYKVAVQLYMFLEHPITEMVESVMVAQWASVPFEIADDPLPTGEAGDEVLTYEVRHNTKEPAQETVRDDGDGDDGDDSKGVNTLVTELDSSLTI